MHLHRHQRAARRSAVAFILFCRVVGDLARQPLHLAISLIAVSNKRDLLLLGKYGAAAVVLVNDFLAALKRR